MTKIAANKKRMVSPKIKKMLKKVNYKKAKLLNQNWIKKKL